MALDKTIKVPLPECGIIKYKSKDTVYVYYITRVYRNENGKPTNDRVSIPTVLVDFIITDDADAMLVNLTTLEKCLKNMVNDEVAKRITGNPPKAGTPNASELTPETFKKLSLYEQNALYIKDQELYRKLLN